MGRRFISMLFVGSLAAGVVTVSAPPAAALTSIESCFFQALNRERAKVGHHKLALYADLTGIARRHSKRMARDGTIYHNNHLGSEVSGRWWAAGENVGMGPSCQSIHDAFMASSGHRANILDTDYNQIGVGVAVKDDTIYVTEDFAGRPMSRPRARSPIRHVVQARPAPAPKPRPPKLLPEPRTVAVLLRLVGLDAERVDPATGEALGI